MSFSRLIIRRVVRIADLEGVRLDNTFWKEPVRFSSPITRAFNVKKLLLIVQKKKEGRRHMREFVLYSRKGHTNGKFTSLRDAGRLDIVHECIVASLFLSHGFRKDVIFHAILSGPPTPPLRLKIDGATIHDVRTDQETWTQIFRNVLSGRTHPGIRIDKTSFEALLRTKAKDSAVYVLEEDGKDVNTIEVGNNPTFVLGDQIGLPKTVENFVLRYGEKISLGKRPYLAASCITILNYMLDRKKISD